MQDLQTQLNDQKRKVDFNTYDMSLKELVSMISDGIINISPDYQRQFRWDDARQSQLIESLFLGIPVPSLFMATNADGTWEVIDGVQRLSTIVNFVSAQENPIRKKIGKSQPLKLEELKKLTLFSGKTFNELPATLQLDFLLKPIKVITLSDKSDMLVRFDLFERLNTGGIKLSDQEIRNCIFKGEFINFVKKLAKSNNFINCVRLTDTQKNDGTMEELVIRFFAYLYDRDSFEHGVKEFLNNYTVKASKSFDFGEGESIFNRVFNQLNNLQSGIVKSESRKTTSLILFEAVAVGGANALLEGVENLNLEHFYSWVKNDEFNKLITGATNTKSRVIDRIEYCKRKFSQ